MRLREKVNQIRTFFDAHHYLEFALEAFILTMLIELISRKHLTGLFSFLGHAPVAFMVNWLIIFVTLSVSLLAPVRQKFVKDAVLLVWLILGIVNGIVLRYRMTPFSAEDFNMIPSLMRIMKNYMTMGSLVGIGAALVALAVVLVVLWIKSPRQISRENWLYLIGRTGLIVGSCFICLNMSTRTGATSTDFMNLADAYEEYGFAYCFSTSLVDVGISKPGGYGEDMMADIFAGMEDAGEQPAGRMLFQETEPVKATVETSLIEEDLKTASSVKTENAETAIEETESISADVQGTPAAFDSQNRPNIIMIQLESFFDPAYLIHYQTSEDPIPNFRRLKEQYASGFLTVPVVGAGTANTEFEILTGMSTGFFGAGEYPYNTVLKTKVTEAIPQILKQYGYHSTAIHNNTGTFYNRHIVFSHMGFDQFIPMEYMYDMETTPNNWVKDNILTDIMMETMKGTEQRDFLYTITVQSHGRYPSEQVLDHPLITVTTDEERVNINPVEYYVNMIHEVDEMVGQLVDELRAWDEPTVLVMYGDHLPALGFSAEDVSLPSLYQTEYVVWNNFGMEIPKQDMQAESLGTGILQLFDLDHGIVPLFHETYDGTEEYDERLKSLEYDLFYGDGYLYRMFFGDALSGEGDEKTDASDYYSASDLYIGYRPISIDHVTVDEEGLTVYGENFTPSSCIVVDGKIKGTEYIDTQTLKLEDVPKKIDELYVGQFDEKLEQLGEGTNVLYGVITEENETE